MKPFTLETKMLTLRGVFYPTGYMFVMFPTLEDARQAEHDLVASGFNGEAISLLPSQTIMEQIASTVYETDSPLPSAGTEADTVRHFTELAEQGHCALMIHAPSAQETEQAMTVLRQEHVSTAQKYRRLVIEDLA